MPYTTGVTRRKVLKKLGVAGTTGLIGSLLLPSNVVGKTGDFVEIVTVRDRHGPVETKLVPISWYNHFKTSLRVLETNRTKLMAKNGVKRTGLVSSEKTFGGKSGFDIMVDLKETGVRENIPNNLGGIRVRTQIAEESKLVSNCVNKDRHSDIPGGVEIEYEKNNGDIVAGTSFGRVWNSYDYNYYLMTAAHLFHDTNSCTDISGKVVQQGYDDNIGMVNDYNNQADYAIIEDTAASDQQYPQDYIGMIEEGDGTQYDIDGYYTKEGLGDLKSSNEEIRSMGTTTGVTTGQIQEIGISENYSGNCVTFEGEGVDTSCNVATGDSGGPVYNIVDGKARTISMVNKTEGSRVGTISCYSYTVDEWSGLSGYSCYDLATYKGYYPA